MKNDMNCAQKAIIAIELLAKKKQCEVTLQLIDIGMSDLTDYEKELLISFYIDKGQYTAERMGEKYFRERTSVYTDKDKALRKIENSIAGIFE